MFTPNDCALLVIDVQGNLATRMHNHQQLFRNIANLIHAARTLNIPVLATEQAPEKIGETIAEIKQLLTPDLTFSKTTFSSWRNDDVRRHLTDLGRHQIIIAGIETHVCVIQTVRDLLDEGFRVHLIADAISSRDPFQDRLAYDRMRTWGAGILSLEMQVTELIEGSDHPAFKSVLALLKQTTGNERS